MLTIAAGDAHAARIEMTKMSDKPVIYSDKPVNSSDIPVISSSQSPKPQNPK